MTNERILTAPQSAQFPRHAGLIYSLAAIVFAVSQLLATPVYAQGGGYDDENTEVLTRGPVHEAFATVVDYNPGRGLVTRKRPPDPIEEMPPEERPEGDNVAWIPGYWAWDDEQTDYIWVSGTWRVPPPGREWVPGYWADSEGEFIWIAGYWAEVEVRQTTYLPPPPESLESGPNIDRPSLDYGWTPGCWVWQRGDYVWRPGYWARGRGDWVWIPAYYVWTPHGYIFIDGYWDYVVARRGIVYAPVRFRSRTYVRRGYYYSPRIVFNIGLFSDHLFLRPRWCHYYFGDYYDPRYESAGFYFTFSYHYSWRGYDPFYSYWSWENRRERDWESRYQASYRYRRENEIARPPSTWSAQVAIYSSTTTTTRDRVIVAGTTTQLASTKEFSPKFRRVNEEERRTWADRGQQVKTSRDERRTLEVRSTGRSTRGAGAVAEPSKVEQRPKSAIASKPTRELKSEFVPPSTPRAPKPDPKVRSGAATQSERTAGAPRQGAAQPKPDRPAQSRPQETERAQERGAAAQRETEGTRKSTSAASEQTTQRRAAESEARAKNEAQARERSEAQARAKNEAQARERNEAQEREKRANAQKTREAEARQRDEAQAQAKREGAERERAQKAKEQEEAKQRAAEAQRKRDVQAAERRAQESEAAAKREAQARENRAAEERAKAAQAKERSEANQRAKEASSQKSRGSQKQEKGKSNEDEEGSSEKEKGSGRP